MKVIFDSQTIVLSTEDVKFRMRDNQPEIAWGTSRVVLVDPATHKPVAVMLPVRDNEVVTNPPTDGRPCLARAARPVSRETWKNPGCIRLPNR